MNECNLDSSISMEIYEKIIHIIYEEHNNITKEWLEQQQTSYNLGKTYMCNICNVHSKSIIVPEFQQYMYSYRNTLFSLYFKILERIQIECGINIEGRIKNEDSIINKIAKKSQELEGKIPVNKCLNDLIGFRIIDAKYDTNIVKLVNYLDDIVGSGKARIRHLKRINGQYNGYHIYFRGMDNKFFPAELQIWDINNEKNNRDSHAIYKKEYTKWVKEYNEYFERSE